MSKPHKDIDLGWLELGVVSRLMAMARKAKEGSWERADILKTAKEFRSKALKRWDKKWDDLLKGVDDE